MERASLAPREIKDYIHTRGRIRALRSRTGRSACAYDYISAGKWLNPESDEREREEQREKRKGCRLRDVVRRRIPVLVRLDPRRASLSRHLSLCPVKYNYIELTISLAHMTDSLSVNSIYVYIHTSFCPSTTTIRFFKSLNFSSCSYFSFLLSFSISLSLALGCARVPHYLSRRCLPPIYLLLTAYFPTLAIFCSRRERGLRDALLPTYFEFDDSLKR